METKENGVKKCWRQRRPWRREDAEMKGNKRSCKEELEVKKEDSDKENEEKEEEEKT